MVAARKLQDDSDGKYVLILKVAIQHSQIRRFKRDSCKRQTHESSPQKKDRSKGRGMGSRFVATRTAESKLYSIYIPDKAQRELRELVSYRNSLVADKTRELNRLQKMLEGANIKISGTISQINGKSARNLLELLVEGQKVDRKKLAWMKENKQLANNLKATPEQLADDLNGVLSKWQRQMTKELFRHIDELDKHIVNLDEQIDDHMKSEEEQAVEAIQNVTGIGPDSAKAIIAVIGTNMERFPTDSHIFSWAELCPGDHESAKKRKSGKIRKGNKRCCAVHWWFALTQPPRSRLPISTHSKKINAHRGKKRACVVVSHSMLIAIYHMLKEGVAFERLSKEITSTGMAGYDDHGCL